MSEKEKSEQKRETGDPPALEWLTAAIGFIMVVGALGFLIYQAVAEKSMPPNISVQVDSINSTSGGFLVNFHVKNRGAMTASALTVEGELSKNGETIETSSAAIAYSPSNSERKGGLLFTKNPNDFDFKIRATGYEEP